MLTRVLTFALTNRVFVLALALALVAAPYAEALAGTRHG